MPNLSKTPPTFSFRRVDLSAGNILYIVRVDEISPPLKAYIDSVIAKIVYGPRVVDLTRVKKKFISFLKNKKGQDQEIGAIAEFFVHLFLTKRGLKPAFTFLNLEENSLKKGFDGLYTFGNEQWLCESKSGSLGSKRISHGTKVTEAYNDLKNKIGGGGSNNPWLNAYNHAKMVDVNKSLLDQIAQLSDNFEDEVYHDIDKFNIIPSATIYLDGKSAVSKADIEREVRKAIQKFQYKNIRVICITNDSVDSFWKYLQT